MAIDAGDLASWAFSHRQILAFLAGVVWLVLTVPAAGVAMMSPMASDGGVSPAIYIFILACLALPGTTLAAAVCSFVSAMTGNMQFVAVGSAPPFVALLLAFGAMAGPWAKP